MNPVLQRDGVTHSMTVFVNSASNGSAAARSSTNEKLPARGSGWI